LWKKAPKYLKHGLAALLLFLLLPGCHPGDSATKAIASPAASSPTSLQTSPSNDTAAAMGYPSFDAEEAFTLLKKQVDFGPRYLGTEAHAKTLQFLRDEMQKCADVTVEQRFFYRDMPVTNVIGVFYAKGQTHPDQHPILLMAHWDTRPVADGPYSSELAKGPFKYGPHGWNRLAPIPGANDGASGVAVLLELAKLFHKQHPPVGVLLLLDDGEDYGDFEANDFRGDGVELGSRYFATHYTEDPRFGHPAYGILLDMVGGKDMRIYPEQNSAMYAPDINDRVFGTAQVLGYGDIFVRDTGQTVDIDDDHLAMNTQGHIATIDLIQPLPDPNHPIVGEYRPWHTLEDDVAHCSVKSLKAVGETIARVIYTETAN